MQWYPQKVLINMKTQDFAIMKRPCTSASGSFAFVQIRIVKLRLLVIMIA